MRFSLASLILASGIILSASAIAGETNGPGTISIQGQGHISAEPDTAFINSGVTTQAKTAREALSANTASMTNLIIVLENAGIEPKDIQTANFSIQPQYVYADSSGNKRPPRIVGYSVSNSVAVRVREIENLGVILDQIVSVGANTINNISFSVKDTDALYNEARERAMADAIQKANLYANAASVELGRITSISENGGFQPQPVGAPRLAMMEMAASAPVPVQAGELTYNITVSVQWELEQ